MATVSRSMAAIALVALLAGLLGACQSTPQVEPAEVTLQMSWFHSVEYAGFYAAEAQGYYAEENLTVTMVPFSFEILQMDEVAAGRADFGVAGGDQLIIAQSQGQPLRSIGVLFRKSPICMMTLADSGIRGPRDMVGKRVGIFSPNLDNVNDIQMVAMLNQVDIDLADIETVLIEDYSVGSLTSGAMDVYNGFATNEAVDAQRQGIDLNLIFPQDYGVLIYANVLFTSEQMLQEHPDVVERFVRATFRGYQYAVEHPEEMAALALQYDDTLDESFQADSMQVEIPFIDTGDVPIGTMDAAVWQSTMDIMVAQGFIDAPLELETLYTNEFIPQD